MIKVKIRYADVVKPQAKDIAESMRVEIENKTGKKMKVKKLTIFSDEMRIEFQEAHADDV